MSQPRYPALFQVNTRVRLSELAAALGRPATLDDIPDVELDRLAADGFDIVWFLGVWQTGTPRGASRARIPSGSPSTDASSPTSVRKPCAARVSRSGLPGARRLRRRRGARPSPPAPPASRLAPLLDFVPNHMAPDHRWVSEHPDFFVTGTEEQLAAAPRNYCRVETGQGTRILAYGRDPYFDGWPDTLQLNYGNAALQEAMLGG